MLKFQHNLTRGFPTHIAKMSAHLIPLFFTLATNTLVWELLCCIKLLHVYPVNWILLFQFMTTRAFPYYIFSSSSTSSINVTLLT